MRATSAATTRWSGRCRKQSQFILITHNKRTMEVVDTLYGVTMEEPGISKLVSVRLREATAANDDQAVA